MTQGEVYTQALARQQWAEQHINKLQTALIDFRAVDQCSIGIKQDAKTSDITYYVKHVPAIPCDLALIVGDALHSLRSALDYVACGMVVAGGGKVTSKTKFPIVKVAPDWEVSGLRMVDGANQLAIEALRRIAPYEGGNFPLWVLHRWNNIDKHRLLLAACLINSGRTIGPNEQPAQLNGAEAGIIADTSQGRARFTVRTAPVIPLYEGCELLTVPVTQAKEDMGFFMEVAISEPSLAEGTPALFMLRWINSEVSTIIRDLARFLL